MSEAEIWNGESPLSWAKVGGPPENWQQIDVIDLATGERLRDVIEVNTTGGWAIVHRMVDGKPVLGGVDLATDRIEGRFELRLRRS